jgi:hypothetical protein
MYRIATLSSVAAKDKPAGGDAGHSSGSDSEGEQRQSFYVGGSEHSGQTVLGNPKNDPNLIRNVFTAARAHGAEPVIDESSSSAAPAREWYMRASIRLQVVAAHLLAAVTDLTR